MLYGVCVYVYVCVCVCLVVKRRKKVAIKSGVKPNAHGRGLKAGKIPVLGINGGAQSL